MRRMRMFVEEGNEWEVYTDEESQRKVYFNRKTGETDFKSPTTKETELMEEAAINHGWSKYVDEEDGVEYFFNEVSNRTTTTSPDVHIDSPLSHHHLTRSPAAARGGNEDETLGGTKPKVHTGEERRKVDFSPIAATTVKKPFDFIQAGTIKRSLHPLEQTELGKFRRIFLSLLRSGEVRVKKVDLYRALKAEEKEEGFSVLPRNRRRWSVFAPLKRYLEISAFPGANSVEGTVSWLELMNFLAAFNLHEEEEEKDEEGMPLGLDACDNLGIKSLSDHISWIGKEISKRSWMERERGRLLDSERGRLLDSERGRLLDSERGRLLDSERGRLLDSGAKGKLVPDAMDVDNHIHWMARQLEMKERKAALRPGRTSVATRPSPTAGKRKKKKKKAKGVRRGPERDWKEAGKLRHDPVKMKAVLRYSPYFGAG